MLPKNVISIFIATIVLKNQGIVLILDGSSDYTVDLLKALVYIIKYVNLNFLNAWLPLHVYTMFWATVSTMGKENQRLVSMLHCDRN